MKPLRHVSLEDKYKNIEGEAYITGGQALVLACMMRRRIDRANGDRTKGFVSGYRGSPVATLDNDFWGAQKFLGQSDVYFHPGLNEDLAATAVWGTQQVHLHGETNADGVFGMWYGKGAGLDRSGDVMRHAHGAGTMPLGGVLAVSGDDHTLKSSSQAYHCEPFFMDMLMPVLYPSNIQEIVDYAVLGWEMSRFSGCWVGLKVLAEGVNSTSSVDLSLGRHAFLKPDEEGLSQDRFVRWPDPWADVERRLYEAKLPAALAFAKVNRVNRVVFAAPQAKIGIVTAGKSYTDVLEALNLLGLSTEEASHLGVSVFKIGMPWPLEPSGIEPFLRSHKKILVVEEKRGLIESQIKDLIYNAPVDQRPEIIGRSDEDGRPLMPYVQEVTPELVAKTLFDRIEPLRERNAVRELVEFVEKDARAEKAPLAVRSPYFCSGCPHNSSTKVPDGSKALGGVGCHYMAVDMERETNTFTQMGGEGVPWIGAAPFSTLDHVFVNLGEGTYFHSGSLAIRACIAANTNITFKILFNDAVAMTGGQPVDGQLTVQDIVSQMKAEGVERVEVVTDQLDRYDEMPLPHGVSARHRDDLITVQKELRETPGVSVLIYDQECATEKRRRRKRGKMEDPAKRIFINDKVCEGCGDCSEVSNCLSVIPRETEFGRKRKIDQSACNKDFSCVKGFCPSFVSVVGGELDKSPTAQVDLVIANLPDPQIPSIENGDTYNIFVTGVGGAGVVTIGALLGMAAYLEGKGFVVHDRLGMAQKFGGVTSHVRIAKHVDDIQAVRIPKAQADVLIGGDLHVTALPTTLELTHTSKTHVLLNSDQMITGEFPRNPSFDFQQAALTKRISDGFDAPPTIVSATKIALALTGDAIGANMFLLGYALQSGWLPVGLESLERAIEINGIAVEANKRALALGRYGASDMSSLMAAISNTSDATAEAPKSVDELIEHRSRVLVDYQDEKYSARYLEAVRELKLSEQRVMGSPGELTEAVAKNLFKLMAYKDEYEVARLHTDPSFRAEIAAQMKGKYKLKFHMAPPLLSKRDRETGHLLKREFGPWVLTVMKYLAKMKGLRGSRFDIFGYTTERRMERSLIQDYLSMLKKVGKNLTSDNYDIAVALSQIPDQIRGFGHVKEANFEKAKAQEALLLKQFIDGAVDTTVQAAQ